MNPAPIVLFVYNRPWHTQQTVEALQKNELASESILYVFADGEKANATVEQKENIAEVKRYIHSISGFKEIHIEESIVNKGLANSVISGVTKVIEKYGKVIVLEDDIVTHPFFLRFMNEALEYYENDSRIFMIGGFNSKFKIPTWYKKDVFIVHRSCSWGWGMWKDRWDLADWSVSGFDEFVSDPKQVALFNRGGNDMAPMLSDQMAGRIDSWAIRWDYCMYKYNGYCLHYRYSLAENIGFDLFGTHCANNSHLNDAASLSDDKYAIRFVKNIRPSNRIEFNFKQYNDNVPAIPFLKRMKRFVKSIISPLINKHHH